MKILAFNGSPRKGGNTDVLLAAVARGAAAAGGEVVSHRLNAMKFRPCQSCGGCEKAGECVLQDDLSPLYAEILAVRRIIIASPIYFYGVTAQAKAFIDRMQAFWSRRRLLEAKGEWRDDPGRRGLFLSVAATRGQKLFDGAMLEVRYGLDAMGFAYSGDLLVPGVDRKGEMALKKEILARAEELGRSFAAP